MSRFQTMLGTQGGLVCDVHVQLPISRLIENPKGPVCK